MIKQSSSTVGNTVQARERDMGYPVPQFTSRGDGITVYNRSMNLEVNPQDEIPAPRRQAAAHMAEERTTTTHS